MMRRLFFVSTLVFWLAVLGFWAAGAWLPRERTVAAERAYRLAEVSVHASELDCWMVIDESVFDFTAYVAEHPADPAVFLPWCGKEATEAYKTKTKGRPHSSRADQLLPRYRIGALTRAR